MANTIPLQPDGSAAIPVVNSTQQPQGNTAVPVYLYNAYPTDRPIQGGYPRPIVQITDADLVQNGGKYSLEGRPFAMPMYLSNQPTQTGDAPLVVYVVG